MTGCQIQRPHCPPLRGSANHSADTSGRTRDGTTVAGRFAPFFLVCPIDLASDDHEGLCSSLSRCPDTTVTSGFHAIESAPTSGALWVSDVQNANFFLHALWMHSLPCSTLLGCQDTSMSSRSLCGDEGKPGGLPQCPFLWLSHRSLP